MSRVYLDFNTKNMRNNMQLNLASIKESIKNYDVFRNSERQLLALLLDLSENNSSQIKIANRALQDLSGLKSDVTLAKALKNLMCQKYITVEKDSGSRRGVVNIELNYNKLADIKSHYDNKKKIKQNYDKI